ncbi:hypothetical protein Scep_022905 [Stephania cephalantha]|uniref:Bet v I/Major latex protein domain-containing protein n=1 Tax=Stephania cephalantha TaxID=152367 RepID=A0AAP0F7B2_9MAGN
MAQIHRLQVETEVKSSAAKFYNMVKNNMTELTKVFPECYKSIEFVEGNGRTVGSVMLWKYVVVSPKVLTTKEKIEEIDDKTRSITYKVIEGEIMDIYRSFSMKIQVSEKEGGGSLVKWFVEFDKANEAVPSPNHFMNLLDIASKKLDAYLLKA